MKRSIRLAEQLNFSLTSSIWMALHSSLFRTGFLSLVLNKNAAGPAWPCNSCCRLSAAHESFCDEDAPTQIFTFGLIQLQPKTAQGITPLSALNCSVVNANKCPVYLLRCNNESKAVEASRAEAAVTLLRSLPRSCTQMTDQQEF